MRFLVKIKIPTPTENPVVSDPGFDERFREICKQIGALTVYSTTENGRRIEWIKVDIEDVTLITPVAEFIFQFLHVKSEFLPEVATKPYYGRVGY